MSEESIDAYPLSLTRKIEDFPIGNLSLADHQRRLLLGSEWCLHPHAWMEPVEVEVFLSSGKFRMEGVDGAVLIWHAECVEQGDPFVSGSSFLIRYAWDLIRANESYVGALTEDRIDGDVHPSAVIDGVVHVGTGTRILPGVFIEGNVVIGANCKVGPNCYIRGNTSIGDGCHIGQSVEIKNSVIFHKTNVGHLSYVGDSVLGEGVNFGAGTTTSNLRHDGKTHRSLVGGVLVDTGRRKFGTIVGDGVHTGINTSIYPGRKFWPKTTTRPGDVVDRDLES